jgi:hypothetical protein
MSDPIDASHRLQAAAFWRRWRGRPAPRPAAPPEVTAEPVLPAAVGRHYRAFAWVVHEQRLFALVLGVLGAVCGLVWTAAWQLRTKPAVVVRAGPTLKEAAAAYYGVPEISYDQLVFFLHGCLPLLYEADEDEHPWLPLAEGLVAPDIYDAAERRLTAADLARKSHHMTQALALAGVSRVVADPALGRAAADVRGRLLVTERGREAVSFPWTARVVLAVNPGSRLNPYPFYLLALDAGRGPVGAPGEAAVR